MLLVLLIHIIKNVHKYTFIHKCNVNVTLMLKHLLPLPL